MVRNPRVLEEFARDQIAGTPPDFLHNLKIVEGLYQEARALGAFPLSDPLEGLEVDLRLAKALNVRNPPRQDRG